MKRVKYIAVMLLLLTTMVAVTFICGCSGEDDDGDGGPPPIPRGGYWSGAGAEFHVSQDGTEITSEGSGLYYMGYEVSFKIGPVAFTTQYCGNANIYVYHVQDIPIVDGKFSYALEGSRLEGTFSSYTSSSGSYRYSYNPSDDSCGTYTGNLNWTALYINNYGPYLSSLRSDNSTKENNELSYTNSYEELIYDSEGNVIAIIVYEYKD